MEILWWLAPTFVVSVLAMLWVSWLGREGRGEVDREVAAARMAKALRSQHAGLQRPVTRPVRRQDRSTGVAVRARSSERSAEERRTA